MGYERWKQDTSPANTEETHPFPAPDPLLADALALIGKSAPASTSGSDPLSGFLASKNGGFILQKGATIFILEKAGTRVADLPHCGFCGAAAGVRR
ncbi:hypothetical protein [Bradyrhizobium sp. WD16]|uniref:hypothetical protein n=1 Tax=Bradyrhizobium sp. WD16 TaxID=1521768 RepID=UPI0020A4BE3F|nr:hypothetical protein [Bradyrhizobium sp. WD16]UTD28649.1 hypothetical protein DB459_18855 [Bradyrhizobium sp. WD16]